MMRKGVVGVVFALFLAFLPSHAFAQTPERGLVITPPRQYLTVEPGKTIQSSLSVANLTSQDVNVQLSVEQFSVANYTYDYVFELPKENWVTFEETQLMLKKTESKTIAYTVAAPQNARPGGHYFTLFASVNLGGGKQIRAATVLYVTASGQLAKQSAITKHSIPWISFGGDIPFHFDVAATGNTHFSVYVSGVALGALPTQASGETAHLLMSGTTRTLEGTMPSPDVPGIYRAIYGYRDEDGNDVRQAQYLLYVPVWSWAFIAGLIWFGAVFMSRRKRLAKTKASRPD